MNQRKPLQDFEQYIASQRTVYEQDPLLLLSKRSPRYNFGVPQDNGLLVFSCSLNELEKMVLEMGFVAKPGAEVSQREEKYGTPWTREVVTFTHKDYVRTGKLTVLQVEGLEQPKLGEIVVTDVNGARSGLSFRGMYGGIGPTVGEMRIQSQLLLHPYGGSAKRFSDEQYAAMKEMYVRNAAKRIGDKTIEELMRHVDFTLSYRLFADEFLEIIEYISRQNCQVIYQYFKASRLIARHNVPLKFER